MKRDLLIMAGTAFAVVVVAIAVEKNFGPAQQHIAPAPLTFSSQNIKRVAASAFGTLGSAAGAHDSVSVGNTPSAALSKGQAFGMGGGGGGVSAPTATKIAPNMMPIFVPPYYFTYTYKGDPLQLKDDSVDVYRRVKPTLDTGSAVSALNGLSFGGLDLASFPGNKVMNFQIGQTDGSGYATNVNVQEGTISIYQNYSPTCPKGVCPVEQPLNTSDVPADSALIAVADRFLADHHLSLANYGTPQVQNDWRNSASNATTPAYVPDIISVLYPLKVNGMIVFDLSGNPVGLNVNVNIRDKSVNGVWNITNQDYEASSYQAETDANVILGIVQRGGLYGNTYRDQNARAIEVELGTPTKVLTTMWQSDGQTSGEVIVPALSFPVIKAPADQPFFQKAIVVPLPKQLLQVPEPGPIRIMKGGAEGGAASSGQTVVPPIAPQK